MKKVLLISIVITLIALTGCIYSPTTHVPTVDEQAALDDFANDTSATLETVDCLVLEALNAEFKDSYLDTVASMLDLPVDTLGNTIMDTINSVVITPGVADKFKLNVLGSKLSAFGNLKMAAAGMIDIYLDIHGSVTIWDDNGDVVDYDVYGMSPACAMILKDAAAGTSVVREHYTYSLEAGDYYIRFKKAENAAYKSKNYFYGIIK